MGRSPKKHILGNGSFLGLGFPVHWNSLPCREFILFNAKFCRVDVRVKRGSAQQDKGPLVALLALSLSGSWFNYKNLPIPGVILLGILWMQGKIFWFLIAGAILIIGLSGFLQVNLRTSYYSCFPCLLGLCVKTPRISLLIMIFLYQCENSASVTCTQKAKDIYSVRVNCWLCICVMNLFCEFGQNQTLFLFLCSHL